MDIFSPLLSHIPSAQIRALLELLRHEGEVTSIPWPSAIGSELG